MTDQDDLDEFFGLVNKGEKEREKQSLIDAAKRDKVFGILDGIRGDLSEDEYGEFDKERCELIDALTGIKELQGKMDVGNASDDEKEEFKRCEHVREMFKKKYYDVIVSFMPK